MERMPLTHVAEGARCFVCGPENMVALGARFFLAGDHVEGAWVASEAVEGWAGVMHGGGIAALHDEAAAWAMVALALQLGFTTRCDLRFRRPVPIGAEVRLRSRPHEVGPRGGTFDTELTLPDGAVASTARTEFQFMDEAALERVRGRPASGLLAQWLRAAPEQRRAMLLGRARAGGP